MLADRVDKRSGNTTIVGTKTDQHVIGEEGLMGAKCRHCKRGGAFWVTDNELLACALYTTTLIRNNYIAENNSVQGIGGPIVGPQSSPLWGGPPVGAAASAERLVRQLEGHVLSPNSMSHSTD